MTYDVICTLLPLSFAQYLFPRLLCRHKKTAVFITVLPTMNFHSGWYLAKLLVLTVVACTSALSTGVSSLPKPVYIRSIGAFLPNDPVTNEDVPSHLGDIGNRMSDVIRKQIFKSNGIETRYYATLHGKPTHLNIDLAAAAVHDAIDGSGGVSLDSIGLLACGTSSADVIVPGIANLVHGIIGAGHSMECLSTAGVCGSSSTALKAAANAVALGQHKRALVVGSELASHKMLAGRFKKILEKATNDSLLLDPKDIFSGEFLRYMLSDGAACTLLDVSPHPTKLSYRIESIYHHSFAHELPPAMVGGVPKAGKQLQLGETMWTSDDAGDVPAHMLVLRQDVELLNENIMKKSAEALRAGIEQGFLDSVGGEVDWVFPHMSSLFFSDEVARHIKDILGLEEDKIWTNLPSVGNVGSASPFLLMWGGLHQRDGPPLKKGDRVVVVVPESGHFSFQYILLTVVDKNG